MATQSPHAEATKALWMRSAQITKSLDNGLGAVHGISLTEYMVLDALVQAPEQKLRRIDIAEAMARTASGVTRLLMPMEKIGLVKKQSSARDARVSMVQLTKTGERLYKDASVTLDHKAESILGRLNRKEVQALAQLLVQV